jgi:hypothetical protein
MSDNQDNTTAGLFERTYQFLEEIQEKSKSSSTLEMKIIEAQSIRQLIQALPLPLVSRILFTSLVQQLFLALLCDAVGSNGEQAFVNSKSIQILIQECKISAKEIYDLGQLLAALRGGS